MINMSQILVCLGLLAVGCVSAFDHPPDLKTTFNKFTEEARTIDDAIAKGYDQMTRPDGPFPELPMYCTKTRLFCVLYDDATGNMAGYQIAIPVDRITNVPYDWDIQGFTTWNVEGVTYKTKLVLFVSEITLNKSKEERQALVESGELLLEPFIQVQGFNGEMVPVPVDIPDVDRIADFTKQNCVPFMGKHYYYNMTKGLECTDSTIFNWFPLVDYDRMIGLGFMLLGGMEDADQFEQPNKLTVQLIIPDGPQCLYNLVEQVGITTMHVYFITNPRQVGCDIFG